MTPTVRSLLAAASLLMPVSAAMAQPPANDTISKTTPARPGEPPTPSGKTATATTMKNNGDKVDSGPSRDSQGRPANADNK